MTDLHRKLQLGDRPIRVVNAPEGVPLEAAADSPDPDAEEAVLVFVRNRAELEADAEPALEAARGDRLAWIAYPKAGQLGTDLDRDGLWRLLEGRGVRPVRQVAIDDVWSALRFRPARRSDR